MRTPTLPSRIIEIEKPDGTKQKYKLPFVLTSLDYPYEDIKYEDIVNNLSKYQPLISRILDIEGQNVIIPIYQD